MAPWVGGAGLCVMRDAGPRVQAPSSFALRWLPPGPVAAAFEVSGASNPIIIGPIGSGKTTTAVRKGMALANRVPALDETVQRTPRRVKRCRIAIIARTYRVMWKNVVPSYFKVFDKTFGKWTGGEGEPWVHRFQIGTPNSDVVYDMQFDGLAIGDQSLDDLTRGLELTGAYIYEFDTLPQPLETISKFLSRCGRWPNMPSGELQDQVPRQVWCDANAFDPDHEAYEGCFGESKPQGREVYLQPGGRSPQAENVQNVGRRYYDELVKTLRPWEVARLIDNRFVPDRPGFVVYGDWNPMLHEARAELEAERTLPILIGIDQGVHAAAVLTQRLRPKVWRVLDELVVPRDEGWVAKKFALRLADLLQQNYPRHEVLAVVDPAGKQNSGVGGGEAAALTWFKEFADNFPFPVRPAITNRVKGASGGLTFVRDVLTHLDGGEPGMLVSTRCRVVRKGFNGAYRFRSKPNEPGVASDEIDKSFEANAQDGLRYVIHTIEAMPGVMDGARGAGARGASSAPVNVSIQF